jgi:hypothetical protein
MESGFISEVKLFHFIRICGPVYYCCSNFSDHAYCHHILAINKLPANIALNSGLRNIKIGLLKNA